MQNKQGQSLLSHPEDIHCVIFHVLVVLSYVMAFIIYLNADSLGIIELHEKFAFVIASVLMLGWISGIDTGVNYHNHVHLKIFTSDVLNRWFARTWSIVSGWPSLYWKHSHVTIHHHNILEASDWTLPKRDENGSPENIFKYSLALWPWRSLPHTWKDYSEGRMSAIHERGFYKESLIFLILWLIPFLIDPIMGLLLWLLPQLVANVCVMGPGMYAQHYGCDTSSPEAPYTHSNTFLSKFFNATMFNIGYHIEHHQWPNIHWSDLPATHDKHKDEIIEGHGHVVPFGYYRGGQLLSAWFGKEEARRIFLEQHPDYIADTSTS